MQRGLFYLWYKIEARTALGHRAPDRLAQGRIVALSRHWPNVVLHGLCAGNGLAP